MGNRGVWNRRVTVEKISEGDKSIRGQRLATEGDRGRQLKKEGDKC